MAASLHSTLRLDTGFGLEYCPAMKYCMLLLCLLMASSVQAEVFPDSIAGIKLGEDISGIKGMCRMHTQIPLAQERHLQEVQLEPHFVPGIKGGAVAFANCQQMGRIVRIKLKYENDSREFFDDLLPRFTRAFGEPMEWRGDPFQTVIAWKWSFDDGKGRRVSLELTHSKDDDYKTGNFVKMTLRSLWEEEAACLERKFGPNGVSAAEPTPADKLDYNLLIPR